MGIRNFKINIFFILSLLIVIFVTSLIYQIALSTNDLSKWDESAHMVNGYKIYWDVKTNFVRRFIYDTFSYLSWGFSHPWYTGLFMFIIGVSTHVARLSSLIGYFILAVLLYYISQKHFGTKKYAGFLCVLLFLSLNFLYYYASVCMIEIFGLMMIVLVTLTYFSSINTNKRFLLVSGALVLAVFAKFNYGLPLLAVFVFEIFISCILKNKNQVKNLIFIIGPVILVTIVWLFYPDPKFDKVVELFKNRTTIGVPLYSIKHMIFYPNAILRQTRILAVIFAIALFYLIRYFNDRKIRFLILNVFIILIINNFSPTKIERHIFPVYPPLILLVGVAISKLNINKIKEKLLFFVIIVLMVNGLSKINISTQDKELSKIVNFISSNVKDSQRTLILGTCNEISATLIQWEIVKKNPGIELPIIINGMSLKKKIENISPFSARESGVVHRERFMSVIDELNPEKIVIIDIYKDSYFYTVDYLNFISWEKEYFPLVEIREDYSRITSSVNNKSKVSIDIFRRI